MLKQKIYGWKSCPADIYANYYQNYGGSICVHPRVLAFLQSNLGVKINYYHKKEAAFCTFNHSLQFKDKNLPFVFDDLLFPASSAARVLIPFKSKRLSPLLRRQFPNAIYTDALKHKIAYVKESFSNTTVRKRNADIRKIQKFGGEFHSTEQFDANTLSQIYCTLFELRWQGKIRCFDPALLEDTFTELKDLLFGSVLSVKGNPCAFDLIFRAESPAWIYYDDINGGIDPQFMHLGAGTALLWQNISDAHRECKAENKRALFSLGAYLKGWEYKKQWCDIYASGRVIF